MGNLRFSLSIVAAIAVCISFAARAQAQPGGGRMVDTFGDMIVQNLESMPCDEFAQRIQQGRSQQSGKQSQMKGRMMAMMQKNPDLRRQLIDKMAAPLANKMFDCNMMGAIGGR